MRETEWNGRSRRRGAWIGLCLWAVGAGWAAEADTRPVVGMGATREEVLEAYGWPNGQSHAGEREILTYPQGQVVLRQGVVERMEFSPNVAWPKPRPRPKPATASTAVVPEPPPANANVHAPDLWLTDFGEARREAKRQAKDILALFTGTDWSPPAKRFHEEVARAPEFVRAVEAKHVLLRLDFPRSTTAQAADLRRRNEELREQFAVTAYPTLLLLNADGHEIARVDLAKPREQPTYVAQVLAAIEEARPKPKAVIEQGSAADSAATESAWGRISPWLAGGAAALLAIVLLSMRRRPAAAGGPKAAATLQLPTPADIAAWPQERVRDVAAALFEFEGARVKIRRAESGAELAVYPGSGDRPRALVRCQAAASGLASGTALRALVGTAMAEGVGEAWYVSPGGFTPEARQVASELDVKLIGGEDLLLRLKAAPPLALIRILAEAQ